MCNKVVTLKQAMHQWLSLYKDLMLLRLEVFVVDANLAEARNTAYLRDEIKRELIKQPIYNEEKLQENMD